MIQMTNGKKIYRSHGIETKAIRDMSFEIADGEFVAIMGPSGSGKSTLLNILGGMDTLTSGELVIDGHNMETMKRDEADAFRKEKLCFIFQSFALMDAYTVAENVELPLLAQNIKKKERRQIVEEKLKLMGILELANKRADAISGGQQQRTAIARALAAEADMILADEPTGALDSENSRMLMQLLKQIHENSRPQKTVILVTHDRAVADFADRILYIRDGRIVGDTRKQSPAQQENEQWAINEPEENEQRASNTPEEKEQRVSDISEEMQTESAAVTEMQTESEVMAENQAEAFAEGADAPGRKKKIPVWVKVCVLIFAMAAALAGYCFHRFPSGETSGETDIKRMDSRETKEAALGSGGISVPCDFKRIHLTGEVSLGEITIEVYDAANVGTTARTADGVPVWEPEPGVVPVFRQTYRAGAVIDETVEIHAEPGSVHCADTLIIRQPTNTDVEAVVYRADEAGYYGWQEIISSNRFAWLRKLLHLERLGEDEVMRQYGS